MPVLFLGKSVCFPLTLDASFIDVFPPLLRNTFLLVIGCISFLICSILLDLSFWGRACADVCLLSDVWSDRHVLPFSGWHFIHTYLRIFGWFISENVSSAFLNAMSGVHTVALLLLYLWLFENEIFIFDELSHALENFLNSNRIICSHIVICPTVWLLIVFKFIYLFNCMW